MKRINTILIDDEAGALNTLRGMIYKFCPNIRILAEATTPDDAIAKIRKFKPELLLMDIEMPPFGTSFDILKQISDLNFGVIFITAYPQYAVDAINVIQPWAYLVKPFSIVKLQAALSIAEQKIATTEQTGSVSGGLELFITDTTKGAVILKISDIILCQSEESMVELLVVRQNDIEILRTTRTLKELEADLPAHLFFRTHNSFIVNLLFIERWKRTGRNGMVFMKNGMRVPISVQKLPYFEARLMAGLNISNP